MSLRSIVAFALLMVVFAAPAARAQDPDLWRSFAEKLPPGALVVVRLSSGSTVKGRLVQVTPDTITVLPKKRLAVPVRALPFTAIESIETGREAMSPGAKVLIGVGSAGAFVTILALLLAGG